MRYQRGGSFTVSGWLALLLLSLVAAEGYAIRHLLGEMQHLRWEAFGCQLVHPTDHELPPMEIHGGQPPISEWDEDSYKTHIFPGNHGVVCTAFDNVCWIRI